ncbi:MAG TPA: GNAT family N-acetyltransferase [Thermomicrobiales bacterium]|nr:GNAT family N-acetyltransferase [Thermomicrobiales bacterium]
MPATPAPTASPASPHDDDHAATAIASLRHTIFANQQLWLDRLATGLPYPRQPGSLAPAVAERLWHDDGLDVTRTGRSGVIMAGDPASVSLPTLAHTVDRVLAWLRTRGSGDVLAWAATPRPDLDVAFLARGAHDSFAPHWMWKPLARPVPAFTPPAHVEIRLATPADRDEILANPAIPYLDADQLHTMLALGQPSATGGPVVRVVIAREGGLLRRNRVVGMGVVNLDTRAGTGGHGADAGGAANLFNLGVDPDARGRGIGTALTLAALAVARQDGAVGLGLNATPDGERVYRKLGFRTIGTGQTWFLSAARLRHLPDAATIAFAEALAQGDLAMLDPGLADLPMMPNGESPVVFAARFAGTGQADEVIRWLIRRGAMPDIVALWTVGLQDEAAALMADPRFRDRRAGHRATTPLHDAIERDDLALARALIGAGANRLIRDTQYHGTAADWARALHRPAIAALLASDQSHPS